MTPTGFALLYALFGILTANFLYLDDDAPGDDSIRTLSTAADPAEAA